MDAIIKKKYDGDWSRSGQVGRFGAHMLLKVTLQLLTPARPIEYDIHQSFL